MDYATITGIAKARDETVYSQWATVDVNDIPNRLLSTRYGDRPCELDTGTRRHCDGCICALVLVFRQYQHPCAAPVLSEQTL